MAGPPAHRESDVLLPRPVQLALSDSQLSPRTHPSEQTLTTNTSVGQQAPAPH
jgi:hypothetical protein